METIIKVKSLEYNIDSIDENSIKIDECNDELRDTISKCIATKEKREYSYQEEYTMTHVLYRLCNRKLELFTEVLDNFREVIDDDNLNDVEYGDIDYSLLDEFLKRRVK